MGDPGAEQRLSVFAYGQVHGVGFRAFTQRRAAELGLRGSVRNLPHNTVEVVAEGPREALEQLLAAVEQGPPAAIVTAVEKQWSAAEGDLPPFRVRR